MIEIDIPDFGVLRIEHLVLDYNGTLALDGVLLPGVADALGRLSGQVRIHVVTADTFGSVRAALGGIECSVDILSPGRQDEAKAELVRELGPDRTAAMGNGRNDGLMLKEAALGVAVLGPEGAAAGALQSADVVCPGILPALELLVNPLRLKATLRR